MFIDYSKVLVSDNTGCIWVTCYEREAQIILGIKTEDLAKMKTEVIIYTFK